MKFFNTTGPINPEMHYFTPNRLNEPVITQLIQQQKYFILHAPRQSGKTTAILQLVKQLNQAGKFKALYVNIEPAQAARSKLLDGMRTILSCFKSAINITFGEQDTATDYLQQACSNPNLSGNALQEFLQFWSQKSDKPLIIFMDKIDTLIGDTLISVLHQLRAGHTTRPKNFPQTICLIGVRDVRDYRIWSNEGQVIASSGSAFNIIAESLVLANFTLEQVRNLYLQHTQETGQVFEEAAVTYAFEQTQGQPWLVNALAYEACFRVVTDRSQPITLEILQTARETLIMRRDTHIDALVARLSEPRVRAIIEAILIGQDAPESFPTDDISYVIDLGLVAKNDQRLEIANPIYQEIIPRELTHGTQLSITQHLAWYKNADGTLDMSKLLHAFTQFYRENSGIWFEKNDYKEAGPHLLLMAFLQRIINGGGSIHREYGLGRKRVDLLVVWPNLHPKQRIVIELKILRGKKTMHEGLEQTAEYMDISNATEGHLVIFDRATDKTWEAKVFQHQELFAGKAIHVWGM